MTARKPNKIIAGMKDAVAFAKGDASKGRLTHYVVKNGKARKRPAPKAVRAWAAHPTFDPTIGILVYTISRSRVETISRLANNTRYTWAQLYRMGYRIIRVRIVPEDGR